MARRHEVVDARQLALFAVEGTAPQVKSLAQAQAEAQVDPAAAPAPPAPATALFRHPSGQREVRLGGHAVVYAFKRVRRKSIGFVVGPDGLAVSAPAWVGAAAIDAALQAKAAWILRKLADQHERSARAQSARIDWRDGGTIGFLGRDVVIALGPQADAAGRVLPQASAAGRVLPQAGAVGLVLLEAGEPAVLRIGLPHEASAQQIRDAVQSWLQRQARRIFDERCAHFAPLLGVRLRRLALSSAQTRWGSASADGSVRLNWRLVHFALPTIDYVVAHELAHLREMNHSPRFWNVVRSVVPDYERARSALKSELLPRLD